MNKRGNGLFDDFDEDEFLLFMQEEGDGGDCADDYEADELRLFLREEGNHFGTARAKSPRQKNSGWDWLFNPWKGFHGD